MVRQSRAALRADEGGAGPGEGRRRPAASGRRPQWPRRAVNEGELGERLEEGGRRPWSPPQSEREKR